MIIITNKVKHYADFRNIIMNDIQNNQPQDNSQSYTMVLLMWLSNFVGIGFIVALVFFFVKKDDAVIRDASRKYLNLTILYIAYYFALLILGFVVSLISSTLGALVLGLGGLVLLVHSLVNFVKGIIAASKKQEFVPFYPIYEVIKQ